MCVGIVIEGHLIQDISNAIACETGDLYQLMTWVSSNCGIAWNDHIDAHWQSKCGHRDETFKMWFADQMQKRRVHKVDPKPLDRRITRNIAKYGLPPDSFNKHYLECANGTNRPRYIIADELDFHDPTAKAFTSKVKKSILHNETGAFARYLRKEARITVRSQANSFAYFCSNPVCPSKCDVHCRCL